MRVETLAPVASEPVSLSEARAHLRVDHDDEDALIAAYVSAAREKLEAMTGRLFVQRQATFSASVWASEYRTPLAPLSAVSSVQYVDAQGATQNLTGTDWYSRAGLDGRVYLTGHEPSRQDNSLITVTATVGDATCPHPIRAAILLIVGQLFEVRQDVVIGVSAAGIPNGAAALAAPYKLAWVN